MGFVEFFAKLATLYLTWKEYFIISQIPILLTAAVLYFYFKPQLNIQTIGFWYAALAGIAVAIAIVPFYQALSKGKASLVIPLTALYPAIVIILSFLILNERVTLTQGLEIFFAIISILLLSLR